MGWVLAADVERIRHGRHSGMERFHRARGKNRAEEGKGLEEMEMREEKRGEFLTMCFCAS